VLHLEDSSLSFSFVFLHLGGGVTRIIMRPAIPSLVNILSWESDTLVLEGKDLEGFVLNRFLMVRFTGCRLECGMQCGQEIPDGRDHQCTYGH